MMKRFSNRFKAVGTLKFLPATYSDPSDGGVSPSYPDPSAGVVLAGNVQPMQVADTDTAGVVRFTTYFTVCLLDDPVPLNGGAGVRHGDAFWWSEDAARLFIAQNDAVQVGSLWRVMCVVTQ